MFKNRVQSPFEKKLTKWIIMHLYRISFVQKIFFLDHFRTMIHASISIVESLDILNKEMENEKFKLVVGRVKEEVEQGRSLSEVFAEYPEIFPPIYVKMIESGEISGKLDESMEQIIIQMKKTHALTSSIQSAMVYPAVILSAMGGIGILMATVILPKLIEIFNDFQTELPLATRILIAIIHILENKLYMTLIIGSIVVSIAVFITLIKKVPRFKRAVHRANLSLPIFGFVIKQINLARFSLTLSSLLKSTIPIIEAVKITSDTCTNVIYKEILTDAADKIKTGEALSAILREHPKFFPPMVTEMVMVGERSGQIDRLLSELSNFYGEEVDRTMKNFTTIIEPLIIIILGLAVAGLAVAVIMPMYTLVQNF